MIEPVKPVYVDLGDTAKLSCKLSKSNINGGVWSLNDTPVQPSDEVEVGSSGEEQYIIIQQVTQADLGVYTYRVGNISTSAVVKIKGSSFLHIQIYK